ncbi:MAG: ABC transporter substrate-binding protein [Coriobacteriia bacterium]|nr:ABC transporter substrate-binding protein [Coriobacteriia bacterium]
MDAHTHIVHSKAIRLLAAALVLGMSLIFLSACEQAGSNQEGQGQKEQSTQVESPAKEETSKAEEPQNFEALSVAYLNKAGYEDVIIGDKQGYFKDAKPEITLYTVSGSGQQSVEALLSGSADIAATGHGPVANALKEYGDDIVIVAATSINTGGQVWIAAPHLTGDKQIVAYDPQKDNKAEVKASFEAAAEALGGLRVGVQKGATTESEFKAWLKAFDISFNDFASEGDGIVSLVDLKANALPTTLATGLDIDIMAASQPFPNTALAKVAGSYKIGDNSDINSYGVMCLLTTKDVFEKKEASIKEFLKAEKMAIDFINSQTDEAIKICADSIGSSPEAVAADFEISDFKVALSDDMVDAILQTCKKKGLDITKEDLQKHMPLIDWLEQEMN